jgi:hypothetical protein
MYSLALDNSWLVMDEDEMYDVNGGDLKNFVANVIALSATLKAFGYLGTKFGNLLKNFATSGLGGWMSKFSGTVVAKWTAFTAAHSKIVAAINTVLYATIIIGAFALGYAMWTTNVFF